jgi:hypothetical protein
MATGVNRRRGQFSCINCRTIAAFGCLLTRVSVQWIRRYDSCAAHGHCHRSRFRLGCVQPRLIIVVSRPAVPPDITVAMGAIQEVESLVTASSRRVGQRTLLMVNVLPAPLSWRLLLMMACAVAVIAGTFSTAITTLLEQLTVRTPDMTLFCSIDFVSGCAEGTFVRAESKVANSFERRDAKLSVAASLLLPRFFENRLNGWIGPKQRVA